MVYAVCRRNAPRELADSAFARLKSAFTDWNEVRVSAIREVADVLAPLPDAFERAEQLIGLLQEVFESLYSFDLESLASKPIPQATKYLTRWRHADHFVLAWTLQNGLQAHAFPVDEATHRVVIRLGLVREDQSLASASNILQRQVRKADTASAYEVLSAVAHRYCLPEPRCSECCMRSCCLTARSLPENTATLTLRRKKPR
jgi:endonuclease III